MAKTAFETNDPLTKKVWEEKLFRDTVKESYFTKFFGETRDSLVQVNTQLEKQQGDQVTFGIRMRLQGDGVTDTTILEGNEERLQTASFPVVLTYYRHAVRDRGALDRKRAMFSIDDESQAGLKDWGAEKIDKLCFDTLTNTATRYFYLDSSGNPATTATGGTASAGLSATNSKLTLNFISYIKAWAKTGGNRSIVPLRPVKVSGKEYFILLVHPDVMYDLKTNSAYQQAMRDAQDRGTENPLFTGAAAIYDGVVVHEHENIPISNTGGGGSVSWAKCVFMGAQALVWAWGQRPEVVEAEFDYGNEHGFAWGMIAKAGKPQFNSLDYGSVAVYLARTKIADA